MSAFTHQEAKLILHCPNTIHLEVPERCIGKICAAWRWYDTPTDHKGDWQGDHRRGYCGLAGEVKLV